MEKTKTSRLIDLGTSPTVLTPDQRAEFHELARLCLVELAGGLGLHDHAIHIENQTSKGEVILIADNCRLQIGGNFPFYYRRGDIDECREDVDTWLYLFAFEDMPTALSMIKRHI